MKTSIVASISLFLMFLCTNAGFSQINCENPSVQSVHTGDESGNENFYLQFSITVENPDGLTSTTVKVVDPDANEYTLFDDGTHEDNAAGDGVYGNYIDKGTTNPKTGNYIFSVTDIDDTVSVSDNLEKVIGFPTNISPAEATTISVSNPWFRWTLPEGTLFYTIRVFDQSYNLIWTNTAKGSSVTYAGPALENGNTYHWDVSVKVNDGIGRHLQSSFIYNSAAGVPALTWPYVNSVHSGNDEGSEGWTVIFYVSVSDPQGLPDIANVTVTLPGGAITCQMYDDGMHSDQTPNDGNYASDLYFIEQPPLGKYLFRVSDTSGNEATIIDVLDKQCDFPRNIHPVNNSVVNINPIFSWDPVEGQNSYFVTVLDHNEQIMWQSGVSGTSLPYNDNGNAIALIPQNNYHWTVSCFNDDAKGIHEPAYFKYVPVETDSLALVALYNSTNGPGWTRHDNWLTGPLNTWYGVSLENNRVIMIDLPNNNLNGIIPQEIGWLSKLQILQLSNNNFNGSSLPVSLGNLTDIVNLYVYWSNIGGNIPSAIGNLQNIQLLNLSHNSLYGEIPAEIGNCLNLRSLVLYENQLSGSIPPELGNLTLLNELLLGNNNLSGNLPVTLFNLSNLQNLYLQYNDFSGSIPGEIGNLSALRSLELGENNFSGSLPVEIGNLSNLEYVLLNNNSFSGDVPEGLKDLNKLYFIWLQNNQITGIPDLNNLDKLDYLFISNNRLTFEDIEPNIGVPKIVYNYSPQQSVGDVQFYSVNEGDPVTLSVSAGGSHNVYQWYKDGVWLEGMNNSTLVINKATMDQSGSYVCYITNTVATELTLYSNPIYLTVNEITHFIPAWQGTAGLDHMNFYASKAQIDGIDMQQGDEIGIFDGDVCVGAATVVSVVDNTNILEIRVSKDDSFTPQTDGYTEGHQAVFKIWDDRKQCEISNVSVIYLSGDNIFTAGASSFVEIRGSGFVSQEIPLQAGWNIFSLNVIPENISMMNILQPLITSGALMKVQSENGSAIEPIPGTSTWIDNIGNWSVTEGYKIRLNKSENLVVMGAPVQGTVNISLQTGWNIISYPISTPQDAMTMLTPLIVNGHLMKVQNESGAAIEPLPAGMGWINNIGQFLPGEGYKVRVSSDDVISMSLLSGSFTGDLKATHSVLPAPASHFVPAVEGNGLDHMNVYVEGQFNEGDEIAIFDGDVCVGAARINSVSELYHSIPVSADDPETSLTDGFTKGHSITIRIWRNSEGSEITPEYKISNDYFEPMGTAFASVSLPGMSAGLGNNYPNPFRTETVIPFAIAEDCRVDISIYNLMGQKVKTLLNSDLGADSYTIIWHGDNGNGEKVASGIYICRMNAGKNSFVSRIELNY